MKNSISQLQEETRQLDRLAAQRQVYADAKRLLIMQTTCSVFVGVALAFLASHYSQQNLIRIAAGIWGLGFTAADILWLAPRQRVLKKTAAAIQEMFDCDVLQLPRPKKFQSIEPEIIAQSARRVKRREKLHKWYPIEVSVLPLYLARLLCQRASSRWDIELRQRYITLLYSVLVVLILLVMGYGLLRDVSLKEWLTALVLPLSPIIALLLRQIIENREAVETMGRLKRDINKLWGEALSPSGSNSEPEITQKSREFQDDLWEQRGKNPLVFDWLYNLCKRSHEQDMKSGIDELIFEAQNALKIQP